MDNNTKEVTQSHALAERIVGDITSVNDKIVEYQYKFNTDLETINAKLEEYGIDSAYLLTLVKSLHIITTNVSISDMTAEEKNTAQVGSAISIALLMHDKLKNLVLDDAIQAVAAVVNLLTILELTSDELSASDEQPSSLITLE